jgi:hypothetical protein
MTMILFQLSPCVFQPESIIKVGKFQFFFGPMHWIICFNAKEPRIKLNRIEINPHFVGP